MNDREEWRERVRDIRATSAILWWYWPLPPPTCHSKDGRSAYFIGVGELGWPYGTGLKILMYSHRLMHRKRVTCELYDSYFRLITVKHAIPKTEWAIELLYNSVKRGSQSVWRSDEWETGCGRESQHSAESWTSGWATLENEKDTTLMAIRVVVNMLQFCSVSNSLSHTTLSNKGRGIFF